jgi:protein O-GlcNAc transferase
MSVDEAIAAALDHYRAGRLDEAEIALHTVLSAQPGHPEALNLLGAVAHRAGKPMLSLELFGKAVRLCPGRADYLNNLGEAHRALGSLGEAERCYRAALQLAPDSADARSNLGIVATSLGRLEEAEAIYRDLLRRIPDYAAAHNNLGVVLRNLGRLNEAERSYREAVRLNPDFAEAYNGLGDALTRLGRSEEAEESYRRAVTLKPTYTEARSNWVHERQHLCQWSGLAAEIEHLRLAVRQQGAAMAPFAFLTLPDTGRAEQLACASRCASATYANFLARPVLWKAQGAARRLRVGYLSADYYDHATSYLVVEVMERHDRQQFEVIAYSYGPDDRSALRARMVGAFERFTDIRDLPHEAAAQRIAADGIDILVDLKGHTLGTRLEILALRPAPVQVTWLGYPGTLGQARLADYLIGDPIVTPLEHAADYTERLALLPHCYQPNDRSRTLAEPPTRAQAGLPETAFVFCCFNQSYKITPGILDIWCRLLQGIPDSMLWLLRASPRAEENLRREARARGVTEKRLLFAEKLPPARHLARLKLADLALDTFPVVSHTSASDLLWAGVPLVTIAGETFVSRVAASALHAAGAPELVVQDANAYYRLALTLATDPARLEAIRTKLAAARSSCPLFDSSRFAGDLGRLLARIWANHRSGHHRSFALTP